MSSKVHCKMLLRKVIDDLITWVNVVLMMIFLLFVLLLLFNFTHSDIFSFVSFFSSGGQSSFRLKNNRIKKKIALKPCFCNNNR